MPIQLLVQVAAGGHHAEDARIPTAFLDAYMAAIKGGAAKWATEPAVASLFDEEVKLVTQDKQSFYGKPAVLRRLDKGEFWGATFCEGLGMMLFAVLWGANAGKAWVHLIRAWI